MVIARRSPVCPEPGSHWSGRRFVLSVPLLAGVLATTAIGLRPAATTSFRVQVSASRTSLDAGVVDVEAALGFQGAESFGTGIVVSSSGEVITNNHVINGATTVRAVVVSTGVTYAATVVGTDPAHDIAVLRLQRATGLTTVQLGNSDSVKVGATTIDELSAAA